MRIKKNFSRFLNKLSWLRKSFVQGFLHLVGAEENPFDKDVERIFNRTNNDALNEDFRKISIDMANAFKKYRNQLPT
jgi:hypothetical protein